jgi:hypothetical protein
VRGTLRQPRLQVPVRRLPPLPCGQSGRRRPSLAAPLPTSGAEGSMERKSPIRQLSLAIPDAHASPFHRGELADRPAAHAIRRREGRNTCPDCPCVATGAEAVDRTHSGYPQHGPLEREPGSDRRFADICRSSPARGSVLHDHGPRWPHVREAHAGRRSGLMSNLKGCRHDQRLSRVAKEARCESVFSVPV